MDIFEQVLHGGPIAEKNHESREWAATFTARRGRTPHRFQPIFDRQQRENFHRRHRRALMRDYADNGPHFWDGRHEDW